IDQLYISKGDSISSGATVAVLDSSTIDDQIYNAEKSLQDAQLSMEKLQDQLEDYTVTAPISGTVVTKNKKAGEKYEGNSGGSSSSTSSTTGLAVIYDMSSLYFDLDVDELDVKKIAVGQSVTITADAVEGKTYSGTVENVSVNGTVGTAGVTTYPVRVRIADFDDLLLPGMNIEAEISITATENALVVPVSAVNRGNTVYVKGEKTQENDRAPEGFYTVSVTTGVSDDSYIEILSGLNEGDVVYVTVQDTGEETSFPGMGGMPGGMGGAPGGMGGAPGGMNGGGNRSGGASGGGNRGGMSGGGMR
ncbi:MAG: efflux RND transporter periplasmic adaptor subunit, partial [Clostridia bacterium]|nr:efflux RND transporter periplasmic adaptor subunit [Clostridia bacterium]